MPKAIKKFKENMQNNRNQIEEGLRLYDEVKELTTKFLKENEEMYKRAEKNAKKFIDVREIENILMANYINCCDNINGTMIFNENKYKEYIDKFVMYLSFDVKESETYQKLYEKNSGLDELGLNVYDRYYYDKLEPYFDNIYKLLPKIEKLNYDMFTKNIKLSSLDFYLKTYSIHFDQGFFENLTNKKNHYYFDSHFKNYDDVKHLKREVYFNMIAQYIFSDDLKKDGLMHAPVDPDTGEMFLTNFDSSALDSYLEYMNDPSVYKVEFDKDLYRLLDNDAQGTTISPKIETKLSLFSFNNNHNFQFIHSYDNIFIDGKKITTLSDEPYEMWKILSKKILEGNHSVEIVDIHEYDSKIKTEIIPVKFKHNNSEYNKVHYSWFQRLLNFVGIMHNIRDVSEIENNNFIEQQRNSADRHKMINETILEDLKNYNEKATRLGKPILGYECSNKELNIYNKEAVDVVEVNQKIEDVKEDINIEIKTDKVITK